MKINKTFAVTVAKSIITDYFNSFKDKPKVVKSDFICIKAAAGNDYFEVWLKFLVGTKVFCVTHLGPEPIAEVNVSAYNVKDVFVLDHHGFKIQEENE